MAAWLQPYSHRPRLRLPRASRPFFMCKEFPCRQRRCSWNISQIDRLQELRPSLLLQTWACIPPHPGPGSTSSGEKIRVAGIWRAGEPAYQADREAPDRGAAPLFSSSLWGASEPGGAWLRGPLQPAQGRRAPRAPGTQLCSFLGAAGAGHCQGEHACFLLTPPLGGGGPGRGQAPLSAQRRVTRADGETRGHANRFWESRPGLKRSHPPLAPLGLRCALPGTPVQEHQDQRLQMGSGRACPPCFKMGRFSIKMQVSLLLEKRDRSLL